MEPGLRQLTEAEAWETLARYFRGWDGEHWINGLCIAVAHLFDCRLIPDDTLWRMRRHIEDNPHTLRWGGYHWPLTREGALQRAAFAETQMKRCLEAERT